MIKMPVYEQVYDRKPTTLPSEEREPSAKRVKKTTPKEEKDPERVARIKHYRDVIKKNKVHKDNAIEEYDRHVNDGLRNVHNASNDPDLKKVYEGDTRKLIHENLGLDMSLPGEYLRAKKKEVGRDNKFAKKRQLIEQEEIATKRIAKLKKGKGKYKFGEEL